MLTNTNFNYLQVASEPDREVNEPAADLDEQVELAGVAVAAGVPAADLDEQVELQDDNIEPQDEDEAREDSNNPEDEDEDEADYNLPEFEDTFNDVLQNFTRKWLATQMNHKVSAKATNSFWDLGQEYIPKLVKLHEREGRHRHIPKFIQQRRKMYKEYCPDVQMEFAFQKKIDGSIITVRGNSAPLKALQHNTNYIKLYEMATVKVKK